MKARMRQGVTRSGFTVIEVLFALLVMMLCFGSMIGLSKWVMRGTEYSAKLTKATALAQDRMESILRGGYSSAASGNDSTQGYRRVWTVSTVDGVKQVAVTCSWTGMSSKVSSIEMKGMIAQ